MEELKQKQDLMNKDPDFPQIFARTLSLTFFLSFFEKIGISPNQITILNFFIFNLPAVYFFSRGTYTSNLIALLFCLFSGFIDYIDGAIARKRKIDSKFGEWLDSSLDFIWQIMLVCGIAFGVFIAQGQRLIWLIIGFAAIVGLAVSNFMGKEYYNLFVLNLYKDALKLKNVFSTRKLTFLASFYANILAPGNFLFVFLFTIRYFIVIGTIFNIMHLILILIMLFSIIKAISLLYLLALYFQFNEGKNVRHKELFELLHKYVQTKQK